MKIYVLDSFYPDGVEYAAQRAEVIRWDDPRAGNWHDDADGVMVRVKRIGAEDMARARKLRVISKQGVGLDNIDLAAAKARGIAVCRTPGAQRELPIMALALASLSGGKEYSIRQFPPATKSEGGFSATSCGRRPSPRRHGQGAPNGAAPSTTSPMTLCAMPTQRAASKEMLPQVDILSLHLAPRKAMTYRRRRAASDRGGPEHPRGGIVHRPRQPRQRMVQVDDLIEPGAKQILLARLPPFPWPRLRAPRRSLGRLCFGSQFELGGLPR